MAGENTVTIIVQTAATQAGQSNAAVRASRAAGVGVSGGSVGANTGTVKDAGVTAAGATVAAGAIAANAGGQSAPIASQQQAQPSASQLVSARGQTPLVPLSARDTAENAGAILERHQKRKGADKNFSKAFALLSKQASESSGLRVSKKRVPTLGLSVNNAGAPLRPTPKLPKMPKPEKTLPRNSGMAKLRSTSGSVVSARHSYIVGRFRQWWRKPSNRIRQYGKSAFSKVGEVIGTKLGFRGATRFTQLTPNAVTVGVGVFAGYEIEKEGKRIREDVRLDRHSFIRDINTMTSREIANRSSRHVERSAAGERLAEGGLWMQWGAVIGDLFGGPLGALIGTGVGFVAGVVSVSEEGIGARFGAEESARLFELTGAKRAVARARATGSTMRVNYDDMINAKVIGRMIAGNDPTTAEYNIMQRLLGAITSTGKGKIGTGAFIEAASADSAESASGANFNMDARIKFAMGNLARYDRGY